MPRKVKCNYCQSVCFSTSETPRCFSCKKNQQNQITKQEYRRGWTLKKKYGLSNQCFDVLWIAFKGRCAICDIQLQMPTASRGQTLDTVCVDHDHATGNIRGLLCNACNKGLGLFKDSVSILEKAKEYLK